MNQNCELPAPGCGQPAGSRRHKRGRFIVLVLLMGLTGLAFFLPAWAQSPTFAGNAQHTAQYWAPAQHLDRIRWSTTIDLDNGGAFAHYGAPLVSSAGTVIVPVRTVSGFLVRAFEGSTGRLKYTLTNDYIPPTLPTNGWFPVYQPVIATPPTGSRLCYPGAGGTTYYVENLDSDSPSVPVHQCFYTNLAGYYSNVTAYNSNIVINTPLTADTNGVIYFGFRVQQTAPAPLNSTNSGFARIDALGNATYVLAGPAAGDTAIYRDSHNCAPALSRDGAILYVAVKGATANYSYLLGLGATNLSTRYKVLLRDPRNGNFAGVLDNGTASPMIGTDGDVFFGVLSNPDNGSRGFLLHFSADLQTRKLPSAFGWDYTPAIVATNMVPSYSGSSPYLLFCKYNNYAGSGDGNGINRLALLDPNSPQTDPHPTAPGLAEMREVLTVIAPTTDPEYYGATYTKAVREWCINSPGVNPPTRSILAPSEDGRIYRWDLAANGISEVFTLGPGVGEPYVPTVIGPDGTTYAMNGGTLFALSAFTNMAMRVTSSAPDLRSSLASQPVTFTAAITNLDPLGPAPTGAVTFQDVTFTGLQMVSNVLGTNIPLTAGTASVTASSLLANSNSFGNHFITAFYSGDSNFASASATLLQKAHAHATSTTFATSSDSNRIVNCTATIASVPSGTGIPTGLVSFWDHTNFLAQIPINTNGVATLVVTNLVAGNHSLSATYASDTMFASSGAGPVSARMLLNGLSVHGDGTFQFSFSNSVGASFSVWGSSSLAQPATNWTDLGFATENPPGRFQFSDPITASGTPRFYQVRSP